MNGPQFTPGPWCLEWRGSAFAQSPNGAKIWGNGVKVASLSSVADKPIPQKRADAHLIAAAPLLYEALDRLHRLDLMQQSDGCDVDEYSGALNAAIIALAKARGDQ